MHIGQKIKNKNAVKENYNRYKIALISTNKTFWSKLK